MNYWLNSLNIRAINKRQRIPKGQSKIDKPEKLATLGIQDEDKQSKHTTQYVSFLLSK
jgi:hypothetical protein